MLVFLCGSTLSLESRNVVSALLQVPGYFRLNRVLAAVLLGVTMNVSGGGVTEVVSLQKAEAWDSGRCQRFTSKHCWHNRSPTLGRRRIWRSHMDSSAVLVSCRWMGSSGTGWRVQILSARWCCFCGWWVACGIWRARRAQREFKHARSQWQEFHI